MDKIQIISDILSESTKKNNLDEKTVWQIIESLQADESLDEAIEKSNLEKAKEIIQEAVKNVLKS